MFTYQLLFRNSDAVETSVFQLTQVSLNFQTSCCNLKVRGLGAILCLVYLLFLFLKELWCFKVKQVILFVERKCKL